MPSENKEPSTGPAQVLLGGALALSGNASLLAADPLPNDASSLTISVWVNPNSTGGYKGIYSGGDSPGNWGLNVENSHSDNRFSNGRSSFGVDSPDDSITADSGWHHLAITWTSDGNTSTSIAYLDGQAIAPPGNGATTTYIPPTAGYFIGDDPCCSGREFNGQIDDLSVFSTVLSPGQIELIHAAGTEGKSVISILEPDPRILISTVSIDRESEDVSIIWNTEGGRGTFTVQGSQDLKNWLNFATGFPATGNQTTFTSPGLARDFPEAFFRIIPE